MRIARALIAAFLAGLIGVCALAEDNSDEYAIPPNVSVKPGLEIQEVSPGVTVVVPQGARASRVNNNLSVLESSEEYAARKFVDVNERFAGMEKRIDGLEKELGFIKNKMEESEKAEVVKKKR
jgi:hypothetical protein